MLSIETHEIATADPNLDKWIEDMNTKEIIIDWAQSGLRA